MNPMHEAKINPEQQEIFGYTYVALMSAYLIFHLIFILADKWVTKEPITYFMFKFLRFNFITAEGAYKKFVRLFDTLGSFFGLVALILGIFSLLCDQYDIEFELEGQLKEMKDTLEKFYERMKSVVDDLEKVVDEGYLVVNVIYCAQVVKALNYEMTCKNVYDFMSFGIVAGIVGSLIPGLSLRKISKTLPINMF